MKATSRGELASQLACLVDAVSRGAGSSVHAFLEEAAVTPGQLKALMVLSERDAPISIGGLADDLSLSLPSVSRIVDAMTRQGWVERRVCAEDRRARDLVITDAGREVVRRFAEARAADVRVFVDGLSEAQCRRLAAALGELALPTPAAA